MDWISTLEMSSGLVLINISMLVVNFILSRQSLLEPYVISANRRRFVVFMCFVFVIFSFWGSDWFHYAVGYKSLLAGQTGHMEDIYLFVAQKLSIGYLSFRFLIWGSSLCLLLILINRLPIKKDLALFFLSTTMIIWFSYGRVSISMALMYLGASLMISPLKKKWLSFIVACFLVYISTLFHKSSYFGVAMIILTILSYRFNRTAFTVLLLVSLPIFFYGVQDMFLFVDAMDADNEAGGIQQSLYNGQYYMNLDGYSMGIGARVQRYLEVASYSIIAYMCVQSLRNKKDHIPLPVTFFIRIELLIIVLSLLLMLDFGYSTSTISIRLLRFAIVPTIVVMSYFWQKNEYKKWSRLALCGLLACTAYTLLYTYYSN